MGERKKESFAPPALGGSSLLVVFAVLALTVFALLSLSTVRADVRLGDAAAKAVSDYYTADAQAQEILAQLRMGDMPEGVTVEGDTVTYRCPISDTQALAVELRQTDGVYEILRWQAVSTTEWQESDNTVYWDGE